MPPPHPPDAIERAYCATDFPESHCTQSFSGSPAISRFGLARMNSAISRRKECAEKPPPLRRPLPCNPWHSEWNKQLPSPGCLTTRACRRVKLPPPPPMACSSCGTSGASLQTYRATLFQTQAVALSTVLRYTTSATGKIFGDCNDPCTAPACTTSPCARASTSRRPAQTTTISSSVSRRSWEQKF